VASRIGRSRRGDAPLPTSDPLATLLEDMHDLRMTLAADLTAAAGAADAGADEVARDIIEADRVELARFARVANIRLERLSRPLPKAANARPAWRRRVAVALPVVPVVGAMALSAAAATGALPIPGATHTPKAPVVRTADGGTKASFDQLVNVLNGDHPSASQVIAAASKLHHQLRKLMASGSNDPGKTAEIAQLLRLEQSLLLKKQPPGALVVLNATRKLAARLVTVVEVQRPSALPTFVPTEQPHAHHTQRHTVTTSESAKPESPKPSPSASEKPDPSPSPSSSGITLPQ
jgi:hypothetical protein